MSLPWTIAFYENDEEGCPVQTFLDVFDKKRRAKVLAMIRLLGEHGPTFALSVLEPGSWQDS